MKDVKISQKFNILKKDNIYLNEPWGWIEFVNLVAWTDFQNIYFQNSSLMNNSPIKLSTFTTSGSVLLHNMSNRTPSDFFSTVVGRPVIVKLNSGVSYKGSLRWIQFFYNFFSWFFHSCQCIKYFSIYVSWLV